jgi:TolB-like protein/Tfp pilus assembly protein PilF
MSSEDTRLEIGHVLFIDIVGYSKLLVKQQSEVLRELNEVVSGTNEFRQAESARKLVRLPTGDGMALVFRTNPEAPVECALEIARALKSHPAIQLRMGIHSGPVNEVVDVNQRANIAGAGINMAQRVMDCGDAGHILLSRHVAEDLEQDDRWRPLLHDLGACEVKHGVRVGVTSLYSDEVGNRQLPKKFQALQKHRSRVRWAGVGIALLVLAAVVAAFIFALRKPTRSSLSIGEKSIAVLPFENLSEEKANAFFADGVQDEILTNLARIADLKVISRTSVMQYKSGVARNLRKIGEELGVAHVVEGSVQRAGNKVRVNAQLIDARNDAHLWAQTYDRDLADVFTIQSEIAKAIGDQLQAKLSPSEKNAIERVPTSDVAAFDLYRQALDLATKPPFLKNLHEAIRGLEQAVARDPNFLLAYCEMSHMHMVLYYGGLDHSSARRELARVALDKAIRIDPNTGEVHLAAADYWFHGFFDYDRARAELELARRSLPNNSKIYYMAAAMDRRQGRWSEAVGNFERTIELDPRDGEALMNTGFTYEALGRYSDATRMYERALSIDRDDYFVRIAARGFQAMNERADMRPMRAELDAILSENPKAASQIVDQIVDHLWICAILQRDYAGVERALALVPPEGLPFGDNLVRPREYLVGYAARLFKDAEKARASFTIARDDLAKLVQKEPEYADAWSLLGEVDAALGRKEDAIREGRRACELLPLSKDAWYGPRQLRAMAKIYAWTGEKELALAQFENFGPRRVRLNYGDLKLNPDWDPLRGDPRFEQIVQSLAPK